MPQIGQIGTDMVAADLPLAPPANSPYGTDMVELPARLRVSPHRWSRGPGCLRRGWPGGREASQGDPPACRSGDLC